jgi:hypothetical protein
MFEAPGWDELTRPEQRALIKLFGGGSLRKNDPAVVNGLRAKEERPRWRETWLFSDFCFSLFARFL